jgi:hypothetical protein
MRANYIVRNKLSGAYLPSLGPLDMGDMGSLTATIDCKKLSKFQQQTSDIPLFLISYV